MKRILYLGLESPPSTTDQLYIHYPVIQIVPRGDVAAAVTASASYSHLLFTSKVAATLFCRHTVPRQQQIISVGAATTQRLESFGCHVALTAVNPCAEGIVAMLEAMPLIRENSFFWPRSALARSLLPSFFERMSIRYRDWIFYDTVPCWAGPLPPALDQIVFTSPSTVDAFFSFHRLPEGVELAAIGPITQRKLSSLDLYSSLANNRTHHP